MKRFSLIVSLAACLLLFVGTSAFAVWDVTIESKTVSQNATGVVVTVFGTWDRPLSGITVPVIVREIDAGSYWTGALPYDTSGNGSYHPYQFHVSWGFTSSIPIPWTSLLEEFRPAVPAAPCGTAGDVGYDGVSPDHFCLNASGTDYTNPVSTNLPFCVFSFDVTGVAGQFEFDTACFTGSLPGIFMIDDIPVDHGPLGVGDATFNKGVITIEPNACPTSVKSYSNVSGAEGASLVNNPTGTYSDPTGDPAAYTQISGPGATDPVTGQWSWSTACCDAGVYTVEVDCHDAAHSAGECGFIQTFQVTVSATPVAVTNCQNFTIHVNGTVNYTFTASGCGPFTWSGDVNTDGSFSFSPGCVTSVTNFSAIVEDACGRTANCDFTVTANNAVVACADDLNSSFLFNQPGGYILDLDAVYNDPDGDGLTFENFTCTPGVGGHTPSPAPTMDGAGVVTWVGPSGEADAGTYTFCVDINDGCQVVNCCWEVTLQFARPYKVSVIDPTYAGGFGDDIPLPAHYVHVLNGYTATVGVSMQYGFTQGTGAFDLLLCYDRSVLSLVTVTKGAGIAGWEYFTYRTGAFGQNCGSACPSGYLRLLGIREMNDGVSAPSGSEVVAGFVAMLTFRVTDDRSFINMCARIGFCSIDCGDNVISDIHGDSIAIANEGQDDPEGFMITWGPDYDWESCMVPDKGVIPIPNINFDPGYICIIPPPDDRGDINLNGIANEIGDAVLFTNYFIYGPSVWDGVYYENQILATDINDDGIVTTVADLVYLIRILTGDAVPYGESGEAKVNPYASALDVNAEMVDGSMVVTTNSSTALGAGHLVFRYTGLTVGAPTTNSGLDVKANAANGELRVLVYSMEHNTVNAGTTQFVTIPVEGIGSIELVEAEFSDANGSLMGTTMHRVAPPTEFALMQNYPNPFNASTQIRFALPVASNWSMSIYNVAGQVVETFQGSSEAGVVSINWNADVASGIYFYKLTADNFTATKKMVLMK